MTFPSSPPFDLFVETDIERYRFDTFWTKEPETLNWIESFGPRDVFYDIGANIGVYSFYAASLFPLMRIYAFEPQESNYKTLHRLRKFNEFSNVIGFRYAISDFIGSAFLNVCDNQSGASGAQIGDTDQDCDCCYPVDVRTVDFLQTTLLPPENVKIDIDGQELKVLNGMRKALPSIKTILVEVNTKTRNAVMQFMAINGLTANNDFNRFEPHSRDRRKAEGIDAENIIFC